MKVTVRMESEHGLYAEVEFDGTLSPDTRAVALRQMYEAVTSERANTAKAVHDTARERLAGGRT